MELQLEGQVSRAGSGVQYLESESLTFAVSLNVVASFQVICPFLNWVVWC